jgi:hypothetical protein
MFFTFAPRDIMEIYNIEGSVHYGNRRNNFPLPYIGVLYYLAYIQSSRKAPADASHHLLSAVQYRAEQMGVRT